MMETPPRKRARIHADDDPMEFLGSEGLVKKFEFVRIIIEALTSLGFVETAALLENESGIPLYDSNTKEFLKLVNNGKWEESVDALQGFKLRDEKAVKLLLLEQKYFELLKMGKAHDARNFLKSKIVPVGVDKKRVGQLAFKLLCIEDTESVDSSSEVMKKLQNLFPPALLIPERRLEYLLEDTLYLQRECCISHNIPDIDLSLSFEHDCYDHKVPAKTIQTLEAHTDEVWFVKFSHNGKSLASSSKDKSAIIWEIDAEGKFSLKHTLAGHKTPVVSVLWRPDDRQVITCGENEVIKRWDVESGQLLQSYERNGVGSVSCGWFHDGSGIIGGMADRNICLWNLDGTEQEQKLGQGVKSISDVAMTSDGKWLVCVSTEHKILFFNIETWRVEKVICEEDKVTSFSLSKDGKHILINLSSKKIHVRRIEDGSQNPRHKFDGFKHSPFSLRSCFGGYKESFIASGSEDCQIYLSHREVSILLRPLRRLQGHTGAVKCVSWNLTDLRMLASASDDGTIRIWGPKK